MSTLEAKEIRCYLGCSNCGRSCSKDLDAKFVCGSCHTKVVIAINRALMNILVYDNTGSLKITTFSSAVELIVGMKVDESAKLKQSDDKEVLEKRVADLKKKEMLLHIAPTNKLFVKNVLKWIVRAVEVPPEEE